MIKRKRQHYQSLFVKSVAALILIGIVPLLIMGISIYSAYMDSLRQTLLSNMYRSALYVGKNAADLFQEMEETTKYLYNYNITEYDYLYELMEDDTITQARREALMSDVLRDILYMNQHIDHVFFITPGGDQYSVMRPPEVMVKEEEMGRFHEENFLEGHKQMRLLPTHDTSYYSDVSDFTVTRNIMNTRTIQSADEQELGTLYIDVSADYFDGIINETDLEDGCRMYVIDRKEKVFVYSQEKENIGAGIGKLEDYLPEMEEDKQYIKADGNYFIYRLIPGTDWLVAEEIPAFNLENSYQEIQTNILIIIGFSVILLMIIYFFYSKMMNKPIRTLKDAMEQIQDGNLDTRVTIKSNDEAGFLAKGLNQMTENLQNHIQQVYIAEIRQRDAEIEALKTQIQPHYLYNTLDVIRMTAITNDDNVTAEMIDSLSGQLKYLIGNARDMVTLQAEIDSIRNYFKIIRIRYENRFELEINIEENLLGLEVPQLIIQPVVENAVKYGLKPKSGTGVIAVNAREEDGCLEITVMDNGVGMEPERLKTVQERLESPETVKHPKSKRASLGLKNVYDRIKLMFGDTYGLEISSFENIGTMVKYRLPIIDGTEPAKENPGRENV